MSEEKELAISRDGNIRVDSKGQWGKADRVRSMISVFGGSHAKHSAASRETSFEDDQDISVSVDADAGFLSNVAAGVGSLLGFGDDQRFKLLIFSEVVRCICVVSQRHIIFITKHCLLEWNVASQNRSRQAHNLPVCTVFP